MRNLSQLALSIFVAWASLGALAPAGAQATDPPPAPGGYDSGIVGQFDENRDQIVLDPVTVSAEFTAATADRPAVLAIRARIAPGRHTYSLTQPPGGPTPTKIQLAPSRDYRPLAPFRAHPEPKSRVEQGPAWTGLEIQEHEGKVTWYMPIELTAGVDPKTLEIQGTIRLEVCQTDGYCEPVEKSFAARLGQISDFGLRIADYSNQSKIRNPKSEIQGTYQAKGSAVKLSGRLVPATVGPGEFAELELTATMPSGSHVYAYAERDATRGTKPTLIAFQSTSGLLPARPTTHAPAKIDDSVPQFGAMRYHEGTVTWTTRIDVPKNAPQGDYRITGLFGYQACEFGENGQGVCELPQAARFQGTLQVGDSAASASAPLTFAPARNYNEVAAAAAVFAGFLAQQTPAVASSSTQKPAPSRTVVHAADQYDLDRVQVDAAGGSLGYYMALAFIGGLILNLMPCVLPVIGLKVMSFVEQAGRSRSHALVLNVWYAAGIVTVFLLLGALAALAGLSWGGQFGSTPFNVTLAAVVFAMALSLLGVWEIPIPGFFGSGTAQELAAQEGPFGAFSKGVITTILATPCTAPFMATATAWAVAQPLATTLAVFASLGLGMASPYLLVGVYPELLRFLPKPGAWMETFKQLTGFVLLATVVFILSYIEPAAVVPTVALLVGIGLACWLMARTPLTAERSDRLQTWALAGAVVLFFSVVSFGWLYREVMRPRFAGQHMALAAAGGKWQPFSLERLKQVAVEGGRTVLVDFSADWCFNCKVLEQAVLHTQPVEQAIAQSGAVTMYADYTDYPLEIDRTIKALRASGVPVIAVFPGDAPYQPIVFRGGYTAGGLIDALERATGRRLRTEGGAVADAAAASPPLN